MNNSSSTPTFDPRAIERPAPVLMQYYAVVSLATIFAFPIVLLVNWFKYETLKYKFDDDGISMSWGILFRREVNLTYRRIQDIHVTRNIIQRWMGLATVSIQTASGSSSAEMQIEGITEYEALRDFLYSRMRGAKGIADLATPPGREPAAEDEALVLLRQIASDLAALKGRMPTPNPHRGGS
ncbi:MAG: PH domain-containing protein [Phycisphaerae bacterium]|nr:PH domain-containing protein [Phycisphaerae bacterium]